MIGERVEPILKITEECLESVFEKFKTFKDYWTAALTNFLTKSYKFLVDFKIKIWRLAESDSGFLENFLDLKFL